MITLKITLKREVVGLEISVDKWGLLKVKKF
jgi:hypothetical protein